MRIDFLGRLVDEPEIRAGFIGCGSHSFRNIYPTLQFAPVELAATSDLDVDKAAAFARKFGAKNAYGDYREMLRKEDLDAVFVVVGCDEALRPQYPKIAIPCLEGGLSRVDGEAPRGQLRRDRSHKQGRRKRRQIRHGGPQEDVLPR